MRSTSTGSAVASGVRGCGRTKAWQEALIGGCPSSQRKDLFVWVAKSLPGIGLTPGSGSRHM